LVADCLPILLCNADGSRVAALHAGWRGLAGKDGLGVVEAVWLMLNSGPGGAAHSGVMAWQGPCIGPSAFEVGDEVRAAFVLHGAEAAACFTPLGAGKWLANLPALARQRLRALGVTAVYGNDGSPAWCTVANPSRFFSYRRDGVTGRMAACIWRCA
jgi:YfiH family protein